VSALTPLLRALRGEFQSRVKRGFTHDNGSVLTLGIGISIVVLMLTTMSLNVMTLWSTRTTLNKIADGAALSGAQAIDAERIYRTGQATQIFLNSQESRRRVIQYLNQPQVRKNVHGLKLVKLQVQGSAITVVVTSTPQLPFGYLLPKNLSSVKATASAQNLAK